MIELLWGIALLAGAVAGWGLGVAFIETAKRLRHPRRRERRWPGP